MSDRLQMENLASIASIITLKRPIGVTREQFDSYWANVHAPIMARMPGIWSYTLHHLHFAQLPYWHLPIGIERFPAENHALEGAAELLYRDGSAAAEAYRLSDAPGGYTHADAQNAFWVGLFYQSNEGSSTLFDGGDEAPETVFLAFRYSDGSDRAAGHRWVRDYADRIAKHPAVQRVRIHTFQLYDNDALDPGLPVGMRHTVEPGESIDAMIEVGAVDPTSLSSVLVDHPILDEDLDFLAGAHGYRRTKRDDMVLGGAITQAGIRTPYVVDLIAEMGAISQQHPGLDDLMLGGAPTSTEQ